MLIEPTVATSRRSSLSQPRILMWIVPRLTPPRHKRTVRCFLYLYEPIRWIQKSASGPEVAMKEMTHRMEALVAPAIVQSSCAFATIKSRYFLDFGAWFLKNELEGSGCGGRQTRATGSGVVSSLLRGSRDRCSYNAKSI